MDEFHFHHGLWLYFYRLFRRDRKNKRLKYKYAALAINSCKKAAFDRVTYAGFLPKPIWEKTIELGKYQTEILSEMDKQRYDKQVVDKIVNRYAKITGELTDLSREYFGVGALSMEIDELVNTMPVSEEFNSVKP